MSCACGWPWKCRRIRSIQSLRFQQLPDGRHPLLQAACGRRASTPFPATRGGKKLICVHSSTAAVSCSSFSKPCAEGMNSSSAACRSAPVELRRGRPPAPPVSPPARCSRCRPRSSCLSAGDLRQRVGGELQLVLAGHDLEHLRGFRRPRRDRTAGCAPPPGPAASGRSAAGRAARSSSIQTIRPR